MCECSYLTIERVLILINFYYFYQFTLAGRVQRDTLPEATEKSTLDQTLDKFKKGFEETFNEDTFNVSFVFINFFIEVYLIN